MNRIRKLLVVLVGGGVLLAADRVDAQDPMTQIEQRRIETLEAYGRFDDYVKLRTLAVGLPVPPEPPTKEFAQRIAYHQTQLDHFVQSTATRGTHAH